MDGKRVARLQCQLAAFGGARSPVDQQIDRMRLVVAGPQIFEIPHAWSFHQFLLNYGHSQLGADWITTNATTHPLADHLIKGISGIRPTGVTNGNFVAATRRQDQYQGARYEMFVAASLLRAGFLIAFGDQSDSTTSHCEFTATSRQTGRPFSVEAKSRHRRSPASDDEPTPKAGMYRLLQSALAKRANHERIIFADVNLPPDDKPLFQVSWHQEVAGSLNELEQKQKTDDPWPQAFVFFTNRITSPWPGKEAGRNPTVLLTAINHPLFKSEELRGEAERQYPEIGVLFRAANELRRAPSHFFAQ